MDKITNDIPKNAPEKIPSSTPTGEPSTAQVGNQLIHSFGSMKTSIFTKKLIIILIASAILGFGSGYVLSGGEVGKKDLGSKERPVITSDIEKGTIVGSDDTEIFKDTTEGVLKAGGIKGEGAYHLERPGGESQNVYLTSSTVDLSKFLDRKIKVWGETQQAKFAGWLMDVGRIEVLE